MSAPEVSSVVDSILSAFRHGMEIFRKMPRRKHKRRLSGGDAAEEEKRIHESLTNRPREIQSRYERSVVKHGKQFEVGDVTCQTSLAHVLLVLNTGLVKLLNRALSNDANERSLSRKSLLSLSEVAAADTLNALSELNLRIAAASQLNLAPLAYRSNSRAQDRRQYPATGHSSPTKKRPGPNPLLARGGWVRSKSGSSVVSVSAPTKPRSPRRNSHKRSQSVPLLTPGRRQSTHEEPASTLPGMTPLALANLRECRTPTPTSQETGGNRLQKREDSRIQRPPSMLIVPSDFFENHQVTRLDQNAQAPPRPPKVPLHSRPNIVPGRRPPSMMTFRTGSTKIGEIPENRLPDRTLTAEEQERIPMPYSIPLPLEPPKKKGRGFKFWKKQDIFQPVAA